MIFSLWFALLSSGHKWGFPRRWREFDGQRNVDVQTCTTCGARRISPVQFGPAATARARHNRQQLAEVEA